MAISFDFYPSPAPKGSKRKATLHARVVASETVRTDEISELIADRSTFNAGEVKGLLGILNEMLVWELSQGRRVHLEGLGYFQLSLECPPVESEKDIRAESVSVRTVTFRPEQPLKEKTKTFTLTRAKKKEHSTLKTEEEIKKLLTRYFKKQPYLSTRDFAALCGFSHSTAKRQIKRMTEIGMLERIGQGASTFYIQNKADSREQA